MSSRLIVHSVSRSKRPCIFCGAPANSKEHAWPDWLLKLLKTLSKQSTTNIHAEQDGQPWAMWHGQNASIRVKAVCKTCNHGWMSDLEDEAQPILDPLIRGTPTELSAKQQLIISSWVIKTAMIFDVLRSPKNPYFQPVQTTHLFHHGTPPPSTFGVWSGEYIGSNIAFTDGKTLDGFGVVSGSRLQIKGHAQTMIFGAMLIQTLNIRMPKGQTITSQITLDMVPGPWSDATISLWPPQLNSLQGPPLLTFDDAKDIVDIFANRFNTSPRSSSRS